MYLWIATGDIGDKHYIATLDFRNTITRITSRGRVKILYPEVVTKTRLPIPPLKGPHRIR